MHGAALWLAEVYGADGGFFSPFRAEAAVLAWASVAGASIPVLAVYVPAVYVFEACAFAACVREVFRHPVEAYEVSTPIVASDLFAMVFPALFLLPIPYMHFHSRR